MLLASCTGTPTRDVHGSAVVFDFAYHYSLIAEEAGRLAGGDFHTQPEAVRDETWNEAITLVKGTPCDGIGDYPDVRQGAIVTIADETGHETNGVLGPGFADVIPSPDDPDHLLVVCRFEFLVRDVPEAESYVITVGDEPARRIGLAALSSNRTAVVDFGLGAR